MAKQIPQGERDLGRVVATVRQLNSELTVAQDDIDALEAVTLSANRTYYVRPDGDNSNTGLVNNSGGAFLTIQKALNTAATLNLNGYSVTIQVADGTYTAALTIPRMIGQLSPSYFILAGNNSTPANVVLTQTGSFTPTITLGAGSSITLKDFRVQAANGYGIYNAGGSLYLQNMDFGACGQAQIFGEGGTVLQTGSYTISGDSPYHWYSGATSYIKSQGYTITASGTRAFSVFAAAAQGGTITSSGNTFTGTFTGSRYNASANGSIQTYGSGPSYFPGNSAGTTSTNGSYT